MALLIALIAVMGCGVQNTTEPFVVGGSFQNGAILPFADFNGKQWASSWPAPVPAPPPVIPFERIPASWWGTSTAETVWEVTESSGATAIVRITGTTPTDLGSCSNNLALTTDPPRDVDAPMALAANRVGVIDPITSVSADSVDWRSVSALLPRIYEQHEARRWAGLAEPPDLTVPPPAPTLDLAFVSTNGEGRHLYIESSRRFELEGHTPTFISAWLWQRSPAAPFQTLSVDVGLRDEDGKNFRSFLPLGLVRSGRRQFWLGAMSFSSPGFTVFEVTGRRVAEVLHIDYPSC